MSDNITVLREELAKVVIKRKWSIRVYFLVNIYVLIVSLTMGWDPSFQVFVFTMLIVLNLWFSYMFWRLRRTQKAIQEKLMVYVADQFKKSFEQKEK